MTGPSVRFNCGEAGVGSGAISVIGLSYPLKIIIESMQVCRPLQTSRPDSFESAGITDKGNAAAIGAPGRCIDRALPAKQVSNHF